MGKKGGSNKGKKVNSVFKVAGAKSLKIKNKAKPVAAKMKQIAGSKAGLQSHLDSKFNSLQDKVRQPNVGKAAEAARQAMLMKGLRRDVVAREEKAAGTRKMNDEIDMLAASLKLS